MDAINRVYEGLGYMFSRCLNNDRRNRGRVSSQVFPNAKRHKGAIPEPVVAPEAIEIEQENALVLLPEKLKTNKKARKKIHVVRRTVTKRSDTASSTIPEILPPSDYDAFLGRLRSASNQIQNMRPELSTLISGQDLSLIYHYFLEELNGVNSQEIKGLKAGESIRLAKEDTSLPRTLNLLRTHSGEYQLILETKQKLANGQKQTVETAAGAFKKGKPAWRIDGEAIEYFNATAILKRGSDSELATQLSNLQKEVKTSQQFFGKPGINVTQLGKAFLKITSSFAGIKVSVYSEKAISDLHSFLQKNQSKLTEAQKDKMISDLLQALKLFHDKGLVHQDLKLENILVYQKSPGVYEIKLTDFGFTEIHGKKNEQAVATVGYQSPEMDYCNSIEGTMVCEYFNEYPEAIGRKVRENNMDCSARREDYQAPDKVNDIWAMGVVIYNIKYGKQPTYHDFNTVIQTDPLLSKMLSCNRADRCNIDTAIELHENALAVNKVGSRMRI